ncbi:MAG: hypothetical protein KA778_13805 [Burkholderiaceae bacterium]|jgi:hypothetical protein|nr:hypothetical protein [Burkholderiaceae bacterium]
MKKAGKIPDEKAIRALIEKYGCPVPFHEVRTRLLGTIATPEMTVSPFQVIQEIWGGELPVFDGMDDLNALIGALVDGLWNGLTRHQKRSQPFRLVRVPMEPTAANLAMYGRIRLEELDGFIEGLFNGEEIIDLPERAHVAVEDLGDLRAMMVGLCGLMEQDPEADDCQNIDNLFMQLRELTRIMESEIHEVVLACTRARRQMLDGIPTERATVH